MSWVSERWLLSRRVSSGGVARVGRHTFEHEANASMIVIAGDEVSLAKCKWENSERRVRIILG